MMDPGLSNRFKPGWGVSLLLAPPRFRSHRNWVLDCCGACVFFAFSSGADDSWRCVEMDHILVGRIPTGEVGPLTTDYYYRTGYFCLELSSYELYGRSTR